LEVQNIERTPEVVQRVANVKSNSISGERLAYDYADVIDFSLFLDGDRVEVRRKPSAHGHYVISDVLVGPFDLEP
jgi:hypothetical protein